MNLLDYVPTPDDVNQCIKPEAEGAHEAVLLAVHQATPLSFRRINSQDRVPTNETELIDHLLTSNVPTGALVVPITGASGVGKSHLVRIIDAGLRRSRDADRYVVIRIPKSASLRRVVELIIELLPDTNYKPVKAAFKNALAEVNVESAAIRFQGELEIALKEKAAHLREVAHATPSQALLAQLDHAQRLPILFNDPVVAPHFREHVFPRIVRRAVSGSHTARYGANDEQFAASDLDLPDAMDLGQATQMASRYYRTALQAREGQGKKVAADVLNMVVDQATRQLFNLQDALGGMTLQEVILEIRRLLLKDKRELILLVEDFAALTGIQETLANVLIQEGVRDGVTQFATMRSVIAVTDGYLIGRDTLATRAMREWIVESRIHSEEEVFGLARALVASYLNAARWGEKALIERYARQRTFNAPGREWLPNFRDEADGESNRLLDGFGYEKGIPLFPFTPRAIDYLARKALTEGDSIIFNPRFIINDVLRRVLLPARNAFEGKRFPPAIVETRPSAEVAQWLATLSISEAARERYERIAVIWGNNPQRLVDVASIQSEVFEAFDLAVPQMVVQPSEKPTPPTTIKSKPTERKPITSPEVEELRATLERWVHGEALPASVANAIRKTLAGALNEQIDWNAERILRTPIEPNQISIPSAGGQGRVVEGSVKVAGDSHDPDGRLRSELLSLLRSDHIFSGRRDYEEFEGDVARIANLVSRLLPQALDLVRTANVRQCQMGILALRTNSFALGLGERAVTVRALRSSLFGEAPVLEALPEDAPTALKEWQVLQSEIVHMRPRLKDIVVATCGCFQGTGETPYGVDILRVVENYPPQDMRLELPQVNRLSQNERHLLANMSESRIAPRLRAVASELRRLREGIHKRLGPTFQKNELATAIRELADKLKTLGAWETDRIGYSHPEFLRLCETFRTSAVKECLDQMRSPDDVKESDVDPDESPIFRGATLKVGPALTAEKFSRIAVSVIEAADRRALVLEGQAGGVNPAEQREAIGKLFNGLAVQLEQLEYGGTNARA